MIPVLDRGYVKLVGASPDQVQLLYASSLLSGRLDDRVLSLSSILLEVKCPLFIRLQLADNGLETYSAKTSGDIEVFIPVATDIKSKSTETDLELAESMRQTADTLLLNIKGYQLDGCDHHLAQINAPISVYTTCFVKTDLAKMLIFLRKKTNHWTMKLYQRAFLEAIQMQWKDIKTLCTIEVN